MAAERRQVTPSTPASRAMTEPSGLASATLPARAADTRPATPCSESSRRYSGSHQASSTRRRTTSTAAGQTASSGRRRALAHGEIAAFDQLVAEVARQVGVLERAFVARAGREQDHARLVARGPARGLDDAAHLGEEAGDALDVVFAEQIAAACARARGDFRARSRRRWAPAVRSENTVNRAARSRGRCRRRTGGAARRRAAASRGTRAEKSGCPSTSSAGTQAVAQRALRAVTVRAGTASSRRARWRSPTQSASPLARGRARSGTASSCQGRFVPSGTPRMLNVTSCCGDAPAHRLRSCSSSRARCGESESVASSFWCARGIALPLAKFVEAPGRRRGVLAAHVVCLAQGNAALSGEREPDSNRKTTSRALGEDRASSGKSGFASALAAAANVPGRVTEQVESRNPPAFGGGRIDRTIVGRAPAGVDDVIGAAGDRTLVPAVVEVEMQRAVNADRRVQARRRLPGAIADAANLLARGAGRLERQLHAVAADEVAASVMPRKPNLEALQRRVDVASLAAAVLSSPSTCHGSSAPRSSSAPAP